MLVSVKLIERQAVFQVGVELQQILKHRVCHFEEADSQVRMLLRCRSNSSRNAASFISAAREPSF